MKKPGFFGSDGRYSFESEPQFMKVPHLRNAYQKVGMFGTANTSGLPIDMPEGRAAHRGAAAPALQRRQLPG